MADITLKIDGMSCQQCAISLEKAIESVNGVAAADVSIGSAVVIFDESQTTLEAIERAVEKAGYKVVR